MANNDDRKSQNKLIQSASFILTTSVCQRWFNRKEVSEMGKKENKKENKKDKGQSDQKKSPPTDSSMRFIGHKRKR
jgi:hypothetical protein